MQVKATREGLIGQRTASGIVIDTKLPFVALPSTLALYHFVKVTNPLTGLSCTAIVLDVGPWNEHDDEYVFRGARPAAERNVSVSGHGTNGAGIDLSEAVWKKLRMRDNGQVDWSLID